MILNVDLLHIRVEFQDLLFRLRNKIRRIVGRKSEFNFKTGRSDSQETFYLDEIVRLLQNESGLRNFRRKYDYREILEHVSYSLGKEYLKLIMEELPDEFQYIVEANSRNDSFGNPYIYNFKNSLRVSPTTLRYIYTALDIRKTVGVTSSDSVVEIGVGYGGQAAILESMFKIGNYHGIDLTQVIDLANVFLTEINSDIRFTQELTTHHLCPSWDLAISNYAFSELHRDLQIEYLENVLSRASRGYMIMNSGRGNKTGRNHGKLRLDEICEYLPYAKIKEEIPLTGPDNYILYWVNET
jgi:putative sugar O-methyltransferase